MMKRLGLVLFALLFAGTVSAQSISNVTPRSATASLTGTQNVALSMGGFTAVSAQVTACASCSLTMEATIDGTNWVTMPMLPTDGTGASVTVLAATGMWQGTISASSIRARLTAGTATVFLRGALDIQPVTTAVQELKDRRRVHVTFTADRVTPAASDTLVTFVLNSGGTATGSQTTYGVTTAKTFRMQSMHVGVADSTTTAVSVRVALRENIAGTCTASSASVVMINAATPAAVAAEGADGTDISFPDGLEFPATDSLCLSAIASTSTGTLTVTAVGYEY